jgi:hypothetical protein
MTNRKTARAQLETHPEAGKVNLAEAVHLAGPPASL